jgi:anti-anti-sigma factor
MERMSDIAVVNVAGDLDVTSVGALRRNVDALIADGCRRIILNMDDVSYADSAGLGLVLMEIRRMRSLGGLLSLINVRPRVYMCLALMRIVDYMPVSRAGSRRTVSELDPSVLPLWRTTFPVDAVHLAEARDRVGELMRGMPFSDDDVFDMTLACGEALGNAVDHTCAVGVLATVTAYDDRIEVDVTDCGEGFELGADEEPLATGLGAERGRGIRLMRLLTDAVSIRRKPSGRGTVVRLVKLVPVREGMGASGSGALA